jgi:dTDP-4-dehydrorhamnose reductase
MRITVVGASGLLGHVLVQALAGEEVTALCSKDADLRDREQVHRALRNSSPESIILCAAYTDVDGCESHRDLAMSVNCEGALLVAQSARELGARLLFLSTDYVFDGDKKSPYETGDRRNPINVYGESKACAEEKLLALMPDVCIVRTSWLFGPGGKCFPATILKLAASRLEISVVNDQRGCPTFTVDLAAALKQLCRQRARGIVHATNAGDCTWYDFAKEIVSRSGLSSLVKPVSSAEFPRPARRPNNSVLSPASLHAHEITMPHWKDAVHRYLQMVALPSVARTQ